MNHTRHDVGGKKLIRARSRPALHLYHARVESCRDVYVTCVVVRLYERVLQHGANGGLHGLQRRLETRRALLGQLARALAHAQPLRLVGVRVRVRAGVRVGVRVRVRVRLRVSLSACLSVW